MRTLFAAYCMINNANGDSLIGVYKRALRIGRELVRRGHEVWVQCPGRQDYHDSLTDECSASMHFLDFSQKALLSPSVVSRRRFYRRAMRQLQPDLLVVGEVPLAGSLLELALTAIGLGIPVVLLDNAYSSGMARLFVDAHSSFVDGMVLTGLSSFHPADHPPLYCPVPPCVSGSAEDGRRILRERGIQARSLILVFGYEEKAMRLAASLLPRLPASDYDIVVLSNAPQRALAQFENLPAPIQCRVHVLQPPDEQSFFGLIALSRLVIGKCGFMQVTEALALGSPFIGVYYRGCFAPSVLDSAARRFVHAALSCEADDGTVAAAIRMLRTEPEELRLLHDGRFGAEAITADFLERVPRKPRTTTTGQAGQLGYAHSMVYEALRRLEPARQIEFAGAIRATHLRHCDWGRLDYVTCNYESGGVRRQAFLWGRSWATKDAARKMPAQHLLARSRNGLHTLELDTGTDSLPPLAIA